ncbi:methyltransferase domain-containing protein [Gammaproteobacteria bacterium]|nr:methyltransferase domain-containing protein [Gammaproteobacteria bacterium]
MFQNLKKISILLIKYARKILTFWVEPYSIKYLHDIRGHEAEYALKHIENIKGQIVEIGAGTGFQNDFFTKKGFTIDSYDIEKTSYKENQKQAVIDYDGINLPYKENTVSLIFSSNTLEHIEHLEPVLEEHLRILNHDGICLHILPSSTWRFWTSVTDLMKKFYFDRPHGEHAQNIFSELYYFSKRRWVTEFKRNNFEIIKVVPGRIFYTGNTVLGNKIEISTRVFLSRFLGSSCNYFFIKKSLFFDDFNKT